MAITMFSIIRIYKFYFLRSPKHQAVCISWWSTRHAGSGGVRCSDANRTPVRRPGAQRPRHARPRRRTHSHPQRFEQRKLEGSATRLDKKSSVSTKQSVIFTKATFTY